MWLLPGGGGPPAAAPIIEVPGLLEGLQGPLWMLRELMADAALMAVIRGDETRSPLLLLPFTEKKGEQLYTSLSQGYTVTRDLPGNALVLPKMISSLSILC